MIISFSNQSLCFKSFVYQQYWREMLFPQTCFSVSASKGDLSSSVVMIDRTGGGGENQLLCEVHID